mgnify:FL=1
MEIIDLSDNREVAIEQSVHALLSSEVVILPTDTVYGIAALPKFPSAIEKIFVLKARPLTMDLPLLLSGPEQISETSSFQSSALTALTEAFWPGPLTLILPDASHSAERATNRKRTIAVRCPDHDFVREVASRTGPIAATSANIHGRPTPATLIEIASDFTMVPLGIDDGECDHGLASTILDLTKDKPEVIREGPVDKEMINKVMQERLGH